MMTAGAYIKITGIAGCSKGVEFHLEPGRELIIGRSRDCGLRIIEAEDDPTKGRGNKALHRLTVSGHHVRLIFRDSGRVYVEDLSRHGTFLNGNAIEGRDQIVGLGKGPMELRLGTNETLRLEMVRAATGPVKPKITVKRRQD